MKDKIFISYTLRNNIIKKEMLMELNKTIKDYCIPFIDIIHNNSIDKQNRVEKELRQSKYLIHVKTTENVKSEWVDRELEIARNNRIPILIFNYEELIEEKFQPITKAICNTGYSGYFNHSSS